MLGHGGLPCDWEIMHDSIPRDTKALQPGRAKSALRNRCLSVWEGRRAIRRRGRSARTASAAALAWCWSPLRLLSVEPTAENRRRPKAILGVEGDEAIHCILDVMYCKAPYTVLQRAMHIHPTVCELIPTILGELKPL